MRLWVDDVRPAPQGYYWVRSVNEAKRVIEKYSNYLDWDNQVIDCIELINIDHDAGNFAYDGGDYIKLLDWLEETGRKYPICLHTMNPVGRENMRRIIQKNHWTEVF